MCKSDVKNNFYVANLTSNSFSLSLVLPLNSLCPSVVCSQMSQRTESFPRVTVIMDIRITLEVSSLQIQLIGNQSSQKDCNGEHQTGAERSGWSIRQTSFRFWILKIWCVILLFKSNSIWSGLETLLNYFMLQPCGQRVGAGGCWEIRAWQLIVSFTGTFWSKS